MYKTSFSDFACSITAHELIDKGVKQATDLVVIAELYFVMKASEFNKCEHVGHTVERLASNTGLAEGECYISLKRLVNKGLVSNVGDHYLYRG